MEAGFYGDTGSDWLFNEVKQRIPRSVPGWAIAVLDFVEDSVSRYTRMTALGHFFLINLF